MAPHLSSLETPAGRKAALRREAFARRDALDLAWREAASRSIAARVLALPPLRAVTPVGAYWPIRSEVDPRPTFPGLIARAQDVALSQVRHPALIWRLWRPGDPLVHGSLGVEEPGAHAPECCPQAILVPLAAFDRRGGRLGYGKGHFDRALAALDACHPVLAVGLAFAAQEIDAVPVEPHDRPLDWVVTEAETIKVG